MAHATNHVGATFGWPPAACVAALENIEAILRDDVLANVQEMERVAYEVLGPLVDRFEQVGDVRAAGGLIGVEFVTDMETIMPAPDVPARRPPRGAAPRGARDHPGGQVGLPAAAGAQPADRALPLVVRAGRRGDRGGQRRPSGRVARGGADRLGRRLVGYADRLSARPGERLRVMVSARVAAGGAAGLAARAASRSRWRSRDARAGRARARCARGSHVRRRPRPRAAPRRRPGRSRPGSGSRRGRPAGRRRALLATWGETATAGRSSSIRTAARASRSARRRARAGRRRARRSSRAPGRGSRPSSTRRTGTISLTHSRRRGRRLRRRSTRRGDACGLAAPGAGARARCCWAPSTAPSGVADAHLDGKLDRPAIALGARRRDARSPPGRSARDAGAASLDARPARPARRAASTARCARSPAHAWRGDVHDWRLAPEQYGAMHFHSDAVDDLGWPPSFELELPGLAAGRRLRARARGRRRRGP